MGRTIEISTALSFNQQTDYGTALPVLNIDKTIPFSGKDFMKESYEKIDDSDKQKGHEWPEMDSTPTVCDVKGSRKFDACSAGLGWIIGLSMGSCTTSLVEGTTNTYKHEFLPMDAKVSKQLPVTSMIEDQVEFKKLYRDICVPDFSISGQMKKHLEVSFNLQGSGYWEFSTATMPNLLPASYLQCGNLLFTRDAVDMTTELKSFQYDWKNEIDTDGGYRFGSPYLSVTYSDKTLQYLCRSMLKFKKRTAALKFKSIYNDTLYKEMQVGTVKPITLTSEGDIIEGSNRHSLLIELPAVEIKKADIVDDGDEQCLDCETLIKYSRALGYAVKITIINDIPAYLGLPA